MATLITSAGALMGRPPAARPASVLAAFEQRLAAALLDGLIFITLLCGSVLIIDHVHHAAFTVPKGWAQLVPSASLNHVPLTLLVSLCVVFSALTLAFEWALKATPGKLLCRLHVRTLTGSAPGFLGSLVRTVLRPVDLVLGPILILSSPGRQRLGDRIAGTVVAVTSASLTHRSQPLPAYATWEERTRAAIIDFSLLTFCLAVYLLASRSLMPSPPYFSAVHPLRLALFIQLCCWYFLITEALFAGTPGKRLCCLRIVLLDDYKPPFVAAVLRGFCYPLNLLSLGLLPFFLIRGTRRRQNAGDMLAGSVVCRGTSVECHAERSSGLPR